MLLIEQNTTICHDVSWSCQDCVAYEVQSNLQMSDELTRCFYDRNRVEKAAFNSHNGGNRELVCLYQVKNDIKLKKKVYAVLKLLCYIFISKRDAIS